MPEEITIEHLSRRATVLSCVLDSLFDGVYVVDRNRQILFWNRAAEQITGYNAAEVAGRCCSDNILNHIDENGYPLCKMRCPLQQTLQTGQPVQAKVYPLHKSGRRFPVLTRVAPIRDAGGQVIAAIEIFTDVSRDEELRILQEKFNEIVRKYVSTTTFEQILSQARSGDGGQIQQRDVTVLYMDIVGFTPMSERHTPEQVVEMLNGFFGLCDMITREKHGDIDKFMGDAIMAVFFDANDAVNAARTLLFEAIPEFNRRRAAEGHMPIQIRIGLNSGKVVQGDVGTTDRKDWTVIGDVVNTAHRVERLCEPDSIVVSETTYARLRKENASGFIFSQEAMVKGKDQPVRVFLLANHAARII